MNHLRQGHCLPMRGNSQLIIFRYGSPLDGIRSIAFLAKGLACSWVCRLSFESDIHSRMILRRVSCSGFMLNPLLQTVVDGSTKAASAASGLGKATKIRQPKLAASSVPSTNPPEEKNERGRNPAE